jgi:nucleoside-diphosphate-sugar epimerase
MVDVDYIIHVASPFHFNVTDYNKDFYEPAIQGTTGILKEAIKEKSVKRIVITSSFAAVINPAKFLLSEIQLIKQGSLARARLHGSVGLR